MKDILLKLTSVSGIEVELDKDLKKYSTMRLDALGDLITVKNVEALKIATKTLTDNKIFYRLLGWGANMLLPNKSDVPYLQLDFDFDKTQFDEARAE